MDQIRRSHQSPGAAVTIPSSCRSWSNQRPPPTIRVRPRYGILWSSLNGSKSTKVGESDLNATRARGILPRLGTLPLLRTRGAVAGPHQLISQRRKYIISKHSFIDGARYARPDNRPLVCDEGTGYAYSSVSRDLYRVLPRLSPLSNYMRLKPASVDILPCSSFQGVV